VEAARHRKWGQRFSGCGDRRRWITRAIATIRYTKTSLSLESVAKELNLLKSGITTAVNLAKRKVEAQNVTLYTLSIYEGAPRSGRPEFLDKTQKAGIIEAVTKSQESRNFCTEELQKNVATIFAGLDLPPISDSTIESVLYAA